MIQRLVELAVKGLNFGGYGGGYGWNDPWGGFYRVLPGAEYDYRREAGIPWENGIIASCINWAIRCFPDAELKLEKKSGEEWETFSDHPALDLINAPNQFYDSSLLWAGMLLSYMTDGNAYWYVEPGRLLPRGIYYLPHFQVSPRWPASGTEFISYYEYRPGGDKYMRIAVRDMVHVRYGVDPQNTRRGLSPIAAQLREICTDNEASTAAAALMRNFGVMGITFTPEGEVANLDEDQLNKFQELGQQKFTGERRGQFFVPSVPGKFETLGFSPQQLALDVLRKLPEERITAALGIPSIVVGFGSGLARSTYSNFDQARQSAYESFLVPFWRVVARQLTLNILPLYGEDIKNIRFVFDTKNVRVLQPDMDARDKRVRENWKSGLIQHGEARRDMGKPVDPERESEYLAPQKGDDKEENDKPDAGPKPKE